MRRYAATTPVPTHSGTYERVQTRGYDPLLGPPPPCMADASQRASGIAQPPRPAGCVRYGDRAATVAPLSVSPGDEQMQEVPCIAVQPTDTIDTEPSEDVNPTQVL